MAKYLEILSTCRDRTKWPTPGKFRINLAPIESSIDPLAANDPVSYATPLMSWQSYRFTSGSNSNNITGQVISSITTGNITTITFSSADLQQQTNYYRGAILSDGTSSSTILSFTYLGLNRGQVTVTTPIVGSQITINDPSDLTALKVFIPGGSPDRNFYIGSLLYDETLNAYSKVVAYDNFIATVDKPIPGWLHTNTFSIRYQPPIFVTTATLSPTTATFTTNPRVNVVGSFLRVRPSFITRIVEYNPLTLTATVTPRIPTLPLGAVVEILPYSYDNANPLVYVGTRENEYVNCNVKLLSLELPTVLLRTPYGGTINFYPFVYVKLHSINTSTNWTTTSNNPHASSATFRATQISNQNPDLKFVSFDGDGMVQTIKFKLESSFDFEVMLPSGQTFQPLTNDNESPLAPNPLIQISALFEITRL